MPLNDILDLKLEMDNSEGTRLNKFLSELGFCSRREADKLIEGRKVKVNGTIAGIGAKVFRGDKVMVNGQFIENDSEDHVYIAFNKPVGIVCTTDTINERNNIVEYINHERRIFPIGRLDKDSEGLIFLTSDGDIVNKILRAGNKHEKEYIVTVDRPINQDFVTKMSAGIPILGGTTKKCLVEQTKSNEFRIVLTQGLNRQIRRMCEYLNYEVVRLKRIRIMNIKLDVGQGNWRNLSASEMLQIQSMLVNSSNIAPKKLSKSKGTSKDTEPKSVKPSKSSSQSSAKPKRASSERPDPKNNKRSAAPKSRASKPSNDKRSKGSKPNAAGSKGRNRSGKR
jgi:23S rRNA pseudouridine2604 synthase